MYISTSLVGMWMFWDVSSIDEPRSRDGDIGH
jgi:hypothetical protein